MNFPIINIDPSESRKFDISIALQKIYYHPSGYQRTAKNLFKVSKQAGFDFTLDEVNNWLERQIIYQIHKPRSKFIPYASFNNITVPMEVIQADILYLPHDNTGDTTYMFCLTVIDIASRYKGAIPIDSLSSTIVANAFEKLFNNSNNLFRIYKVKIVITDMGSEFKKDFDSMLEKYNIFHQIAKSKNSMGIVERFNRTLSEMLFRIQDSQELLLPLSGRSRIWVENLPVVINKLNNSVTRLIGMSPNKAVLKKHVYAMASKPRNGPMGFDEEKLPDNIFVRYLLNPGELEGGRRRATDCNWSPQTYCIKKSIVQKNQPVLYWIEDIDGNGPKRSFVREELMIIPPDSEMPPDWVLKN
jgi:hypothetical protein